MNWYLKCLKQYADFSGRARRKEYWLFCLFNLIISIVLMFIDQAMGTFDAANGIGALGAIYTLGVLIPGLAVCVRRLHDIGKSGWYIFLFLIPLIGPILILIWFCTEGNHGSNQWGENPKENEYPI